MGALGRWGNGELLPSPAAPQALGPLLRAISTAAVCVRLPRAMSSPRPVTGSPRSPQHPAPCLAPRKGPVNTASFMRLGGRPVLPGSPPMGLGNRRRNQDTQGSKGIHLSCGPKVWTPPLTPLMNSSLASACMPLVTGCSLLLRQHLTCWKSWGDCYKIPPIEVRLLGIDGDHTKGSKGSVSYQVRGTINQEVTLPASKAGALPAATQSLACWEARRGKERIHHPSLSQLC